MNMSIRIRIVKAFQVKINSMKAVARTTAKNSQQHQRKHTQTHTHKNVYKQGKSLMQEALFFGAPAEIFHAATAAWIRARSLIL